MQTKRLKYFLLAALWGSLAGGMAQAKPKRVPAYIFGYGVSLADSTAYITDIQRLDTVILEHKTAFLRDRQLYTGQLSAYLEDSLHRTNMTCAVFFHQKRKKLDKVLARVRKSQGALGMKLLPLSQASFAFHPELWASAEDERENMPKAERKALEKAEKAKARAEKKAQKPAQDAQKGNGRQKPPTPRRR